MRQIIPNDVLARTNAVLAELAEKYHEDIPAILQIMKSSAQQLDNPRSSEIALETLKHHVHDMKGQGTTFGYPVLSALARSLDVFLKQIEEKDSLQLARCKPLVMIYMNVLTQIFQQDKIHTLDEEMTNFIERMDLRVEQIVKPISS